jgi:hypothetical protein
MSKVISCIAVILLFASPAFCEEGCGDGTVPKGQWPNCEPCAGGGAQQNLKKAVADHAQILDESVQPKAFDFIDDCLAAIQKNYTPSLGLPSLEELLGALCLATRMYTEEAAGRIYSMIDKAQFSYFGGAVSGGISRGGTGSIKVKDTSSQALNAARANLP